MWTNFHHMNAISEHTAAMQMIGAICGSLSVVVFGGMNSALEAGIVAFAGQLIWAVYRFFKSLPKEGDTTDGSGTTE